MVLVLLFAIASPTPAATLAPQDFAYGMRLTVSGNEALHELTLPDEAYRGALHPDLADICVFNGNGEPVPFVLVPSAPPQAPAEIRPLPIFTLPAVAAGSAAGMALQVKTDATGAIVNLATAPGQAPARPPAGYVLDATRLEQPVVGLDLAWTVPAGNYLGTVQVAVSNDLEHWTTHATGIVASLRAGDGSLDRHTLEFPSVKAKYYRLTLTPEQGAPRLTGATARLAPTTAEPLRHWRPLPAAPVKGRPGEYLVDTGGHLPIDRLRLRFPEENTLVRVTFSSRPDEKTPWTVRHQGLLYRLRRGGTELENPAVTIPATTDRFWLIHIEESGGGLGAGVPQMEIGWLPHRLVFVARGPAPFLLAYGSAREELCALRDDAFLTALQGPERDKVRPAPASAGPQEALGGKAALRPRIPAATWKKAALWGVLVLGVTLLAGMAVRLWRQMSAAGR
jgi:hypothetical protein